MENGFEQHLIASMRLVVFFLFFLATPIIIWSQTDSIFLELTCVDSQKDEPIPNVSISINGKVLRETSNFSGRIQIVIPCISSSYILAEHPMYRETEKRIQTKNCSDTVRIKITMQSATLRNLQEAIVKAPGVPDTVFQSDRLSVADFEILMDGTIVLLTYSKTLEKGTELVVQKPGNTSIYPTPEGAYELCRDYRGEPIIITPKWVYAFNFDDDTVRYQPIDKNYYHTYVEPVIDTTTTKVFFSSFSPDYPAFNYYSFDVNDSVYERIQHIEDALMMELYRSEYKWVDVRTKLWAREKESQTGIDKEIWVGATVFTRSVYYKQLYAPFFRVKDTLLILDHYKDRMYKYDILGKPIDSLGIYYHYNPRKTGWKKDVLQDGVTKKIYTVFERDGFTYLANLDVSNGKIGEQIKLEFPYVNSVKVHDDFVYYIYRPFESIQKKFLYRERLPLKD